MVAHVKSPYITPEQYLAIESESDAKSEYIDGVIVAMSGASPEHAAITFNLGAAIRAQLRTGNCRGFSSDLRLRIEKSNRYYYPDLTVVCGEPAYETRRGIQHLLNPDIIFEVLSESTERQDRGEKWLASRQIDTLTTYVLVHQDRPLIELMERKPGASTWELTTYEGINAICPLTVLQGSIALSDIYEDISFAPETEPSAGSLA